MKTAKTINFTPHDTKWIPCSARFISCGVSTKIKGVLKVHELDNGDLKNLLDLEEATPQGIKCATFGASRIEARNLALGRYDGILSICDLEQKNGRTGELRTIFSVKGHESIINAIDGVGGKHAAGYGAPEIVTGGKDGYIKVWDPRVDYPVVTFEQKGNAHRECWTVAFGNSYSEDERCICAGFDNGDVKMFDLRTNTILWEENCKNAVTSIQFDRQDIEMNKLVVAGLESKFRVYDLRTKHSRDGFAYLDELAHRSTIWVAKHLPQNRDIFMTGGGNGGFNIYKYHYPKSRTRKHSEDNAPIGIPGSVELLNSRVISTQPVVSFDWSPDREGLCCFSSLDQTIR